MATQIRIATAALAIFAAGAGARAAPAVAWDPITPAELSQSVEPLDPDAPAEATFRKITIDDRDYPAERRVREYIRYRIFDPEKTTGLTRISQTTTSVDGQASQENAEIHARLTLPDGTTREFGKESIHERPLLHTGSDQSWMQRLVGGTGLDVQERFLAVSGIEAGAILEFQVSHTEHPPAQPVAAILQMPDTPIAQVLQLKDIPIRRMEFNHEVSKDHDYVPRWVVLNDASTHARVRFDDKTHVITMSASDLPALAYEPFSVATGDYGLMYLCVYTPRNFVFLAHNRGGDAVQVDPKKAGRWAGYATKVYLFEADRTLATSQVKRVAAQLAAGSPSGLEKARAIQRFVQDLHRRYLSLPRTAELRVPAADLVQSLDQMLTFEKNPDLRLFPEDFVWLAVALFRSAGLEAHTVMLPNRNVALFNVRQVAEMFLPILAVRVLVNGQWQLSYPESVARIPFGLLPWSFEGQVGLLAESGKQEFVDIPLTTSDNSVIANSGDFRLSADGTLTGQCRRTYTGQSALIQRTRFGRADAQRELNLLRRELAAEFKSARIRVTRVTGADDADAPLEVAYEMRYPDFATMTKDRIIFRPSVFHGFSESPFSAENRRYSLEFPYRWKERDEVTLHLPAGYALESNPSSFSAAGNILNYNCAASFSPETDSIRLQRDFTSNLMVLSAANYGHLKIWYDNVAVSDQHELALVKTSAPPAAKPDAPNENAARPGS